MRRQTRRARGASTRRTTHSKPMALEVVERHVFTITDREVARDVRQALAANDIERIAELVDFLQIDGLPESNVLSVDEVKQ